MSESRFAPQNPFWYEDLTAGHASLTEGENIDSPSLTEDLNYVDQQILEVSRASSMLRGGPLFFSLVMLILAMFAVPLLVELFIYGFFKRIFLSIFVWSAILAGIGMVIFLIRRDCFTPRDTPIRFDRQSGKVSAYEFLVTRNPLGRWRSVIKTFDWHNIQAEVTKEAGYTGKAYVIRYALVLVICKPGTNEVIDRITLKGNDMTVKGLYSMWSYIRRYMAEGTVNLPNETPRGVGISFRRSFFTYMPYFDPSDEGAAIRSKMGVFDVLIAFVMMWFFWIWLPMGICHYIAMRIAPKPKWPNEVVHQNGHS